jgi:uncharacterized protein
MLGNTISSFLYGNTPSLAQVQPKSPKCPDTRIDISPQSEPTVAAQPSASHGISSNKAHLVFDLLLEHTDALLDALEAEKKPTFWEQLMSCFSRGKKKENGALTYLLWASTDRNTSVERNARIREIQATAEQEGKPVPSRESIIQNLNLKPVYKFNPNLRNHKGEYPLIRAARNGQYPRAIQKLIAAGAELDVKDKDGRTPLIHTVLSGDEKGALALIEAGALLDIADTKNQRNALSYALMDPTETNLHIAQAIMEKHEESRPDGDVDNLHDKTLYQQKDSAGRIPLTYALENGFHDIAEELIGRSGDLNEPDEAGCTPLMYAAMDESDENLIHTMVANGANLHTADRKRRTALIHAASAGAVSSASKLLAQGAMVDSQDNKGRTALMYAARHPDGQVAEKMIWQLCQRGTSLDRVDHRGRTAVMHAAKYGAINSLKMLGELEADLDSTDRDGNTALMLAVQNNQPFAVWTLCKLGANPNVKNHEGKNIYQIAQEKNLGPMLTLFYFLRDHETDAGNPIEIEHFDPGYIPPANRTTWEIGQYALTH